MGGGEWVAPGTPNLAMRQLGGVKPMSIRGRMYLQRERIMEMTAEERAWRAQWLKDQELSPREPVYVPEYWQNRLNPIRRAYMMPLNMLFKPLEGPLGAKRAFLLRWGVGKACMALFGVYWFTYLLRHHDRKWTSHSGWRVRKTDPAVYPGDPDFPRRVTREPDDFNSLGFKKFMEENPWAERS